jgi:hypothetical protein
LLVPQSVAVVEVEVVGVGAMGGVVEQGVVEEYASQHLDARRQIIDDFRFAQYPIPIHK